MQYLDQKSLLALGDWLSHKWNACQKKKLEASQALDELGIPDDKLHSEWQAQIKAQTRPAPRRSKNKGKQTIQEIMALQKTFELSSKAVEDLEECLANGTITTDMVDFHLQLDSARAKCKRFSDTLRHRRGALGVDEEIELSKLLKSAFLGLRMNALALKQRIRDRLQQRKFEFERLERSYRNSLNEKKLHNHTGRQITRREPGISQLVKTYNGLCAQMETLIKHNRAPKGAIIPHHIAKDGLFKLDVDDDIWQDVGLEDDIEGEIPDWLGNGDVRKGIQHLVDYDHCVDEETRLMKERCALQEWFVEEWKCALKAAAASEGLGDYDLTYQLDLRVQYLCRLCVTWQGKLRSIPCAMSESWGPSDQNLIDTVAFEFQGSWDRVDVDTDDELDCDDDLRVQDDDDMLELVETMELSTIYQDHNHYEDNSGFGVERGRHEEVARISSSRDESGSPRKRSHNLLH